MHFNALAALLFAGLASVSAEPIPMRLDDMTFDERSLPPPKCVTGVQILAVPGLGVPNHQIGLLNTTVGALKRAIPNSAYYIVEYPRNSNYSQDLVIGEQNVKKALKRYTTACPNIQIVLLGYSDGAIIAMNTLCGASVDGVYPYGAPLASSYNQSIIASVMFGDESRVANQPYNLGNCTTGSGILPRQNPSGCASFETYLQSYCDDGDDLCCGDGTGEGVHKLYPLLFNKDVVKFVKSRYTKP